MATNEGPQVDKMGFQLEQALGVEILQESYSATIDVPTEAKEELVSRVADEPTMSLTHEEDTIYTISHEWH